jgi:phosphoribosylaminoimidazole carboxylase
MDKTVGVLGGGQLGRMLGEAANRLNIKLIFLDKAGSPAKKITAHDEHLAGSFKDASKITELAQLCDVLTIEIEHVDTNILKEISESKAALVEPSWQTIQTIQDKYQQKLHLQKANVAVAEAISLENDSEEELKSVGRRFGYPYMLKSRKDAYDGRGNFPVQSEKDIPEAIKVFKNPGPNALYAEKWASFTKELAVMVVQTVNGPLAFPTVETVHENSICKLVYAPARGVSTATLRKAEQLAKRAVGSFKGKGVYGVEMFLLPNEELLVNEIAPRPHNSGHYTIEACPLSQYDAHLRAILDLPIPEESLRMREPAIMLNILGGQTPTAHLNIAKAALSVPRTSVHLYAKGDGTRGRKMGHITVTAHSMSECETLIAPLIHAVDINSGKISASTKALSKEEVLKARSPLVAVIMGSDSDLPTLRPCLQLLKDFDIPFTVQITSAHRTPAWMSDFTSKAAQNGIRVIIGAAGGAAHLPGMAAAHTALPVIGVPIKGSSTDGMDSLLSIVQMPRGVPVAAVAINNSLNAALLAARIIGVTDERVREKVEDYAKASQVEVLGKDKKLMEIGWEEYLKGMGK